MREAEACTERGELGALLRREGLYSSHLAAWRAALGSGEPKRPGPKPKVVDPRDKKIVELEKQIARLEKRAARTEGLLELQKSLGNSGSRSRSERREELMSVARDAAPKFGIVETSSALQSQSCDRLPTIESFAHASGK